MNEKAINNVISGYAIENANLKIQVETLSVELEDLKAEVAVLEEKKETKTKKEEK